MTTREERAELREWLTHPGDPEGNAPLTRREAHGLLDDIDRLTAERDEARLLMGDWAARAGAAEAERDDLRDRLDAVRAVRGPTMTAPRGPSWHWDEETQTIEMWARWSDAPPDATVSGPVAAMLVDSLSWVYEQTRLPDPEPEPEGPSREALLEAARTLEGVVRDLRDEADR